MDHRTELKQGTVLSFPGMRCVIESCIGCGSNAIVYEAGYQDSLSVQQRHRVLIKELFPYDANGHIWRDERQHICMDAQGETTWKLHRRSFERGNEIHLQLLAQTPDQIGGNVNTFAMNQTLYTLLDYSGGRSLDQALGSSSPHSFGQIVARMRKLLFAIDTFHEQGLLHLDISLDNILLVGEGERERVLLIDYNSVHTRQELSRQNNVYFSAKEGFMAPEVRTGMVGAIAACTDLFSATCVFYALLVGKPLTSIQMNQKRPPNVSNTPLLKDAPTTVKEQVHRILSRGLCVLPDKRYQSCTEMLRDLDELQNRLDGVGVTHAALWEAGKRSVQRLVRQNPSLAYVQREAELYPLRIQPESVGSMPAPAFMEQLTGEAGASTLLLGDGGMGKSTALLRATLEGTRSYSPAKPAVMYLPLMGWKSGADHFIVDHILMEFRFDAQTKTVEDARHALMTLLGASQERNSRGRVQLLLLLDGLNEVVGDISGLIEEIERLSALTGLRMVLASRTAPENLRMERALMTKLEEDDVRNALARHGLLTPENAEMQQMLRTPMMLSLFIQTAENTDNQVLCQSESELLRGYLEALCAKAARDASQPVNYGVEVAVKLVLPAIAQEMRRQGRPLNNQALYQVIKRCHAVLHGKMLSKAFPEWIGHSREALGEHAENAEAWYGMMVQDILWRQLGLLVRGEDGCYHVLHQILQEYLIDRAAENEERLRARQRRMGILGGIGLMLFVGIMMLVYETWVKPKPYDEAMSSMVMDAAALQFVNCGLQYQSMTSMLSGEIIPEACAAEVSRRGVPASRSAQLALENMHEGGEVIPWSNQPFDFENAGTLLALPEKRAETYSCYIRAYQLIQAGETDTEADAFIRALAELLDADADIAWLLDQMVCMPHVDGMSQAQRLSYDTGLLSLPGEQENRAVDVSRGLPYALKKSYERQREAQNALSQMAVMHDPAIEEE